MKRAVHRIKDYLDFHQNSLLRLTLEMSSVTRATDWRLLDRIVRCQHALHHPTTHRTPGIPRLPMQSGHRCGDVSAQGVAIRVLVIFRHEHDLPVLAGCNLKVVHGLVPDCELRVWNVTSGCSVARRGPDEYLWPVRTEIEYVSLLCCPNAPPGNWREPLSQVSVLSTRMPAFSSTLAI